MKKIYQVECSTMVVVEAENEDEAEQVAQQNIDNADPLSYDYWAMKEINSVADLPISWDEECLPYGRDDDLTLGEILSPTNTEPDQ
jgi:hypothetical protein